MLEQALESKLKKTFDSRMFVERDRRDNCMVIWDRARSGTPYPVMKIACETSIPGVRGTPREAWDADVRRLHKMNWAEKYNQRSGAVREVMNECYVRPEERALSEYHRSAEEVFRGEIKSKTEWWTGAHKQVAMPQSLNDNG